MTQPGGGEGINLTNLYATVRPRFDTSQIKQEGTVFGNLFGQAAGAAVATHAGAIGGALRVAANLGVFKALEKAADSLAGATETSAKRIEKAKQQEAAAYAAYYKTVEDRVVAVKRVEEKRAKEASEHTAEIQKQQKIIEGLNKSIADSKLKSTAAIKKAEDDESAHSRRLADIDEGIAVNRRRRDEAIAKGAKADGVKVMEIERAISRLKRERATEETKQATKRDQNSEKEVKSNKAIQKSEEDLKKARVNLKQSQASDQREMSAARLSAEQNANRKIQSEYEALYTWQDASSAATMAGMVKGAGGAAKAFGAIGLIAIPAMMALGAVAKTTFSVITNLSEEAGKQLFEMGFKWQDSIRIIVGQTGATLEQAQALRENVRQIITSGEIIDPEVVTQSIGIIAKRLDLAGSDLERFTTTYAQTVELLGDKPIDIQNLTGLLTQFQVAQKGIQIDDNGVTRTVTGIDALDAAMHRLVSTSQNVGIDFNLMVNEVRKAGPALQDLGLAFEDSVAFYASLDKSGVDPRRILFGLNTAVQRFTQYGMDPAEGLVTAFEKIQAAVEAGNVAASRSLILELFGPRNAAIMSDEIAKLAGAMADGSFDAKMLGENMRALNPTISEQLRYTETLDDALTMMKNKLTGAFAPLGEQLVEGLTTGATAIHMWITDNQQEMLDWAANLTNWAFEGGQILVSLAADSIGFLGHMANPIKEIVVGLGLAASQTAKAVGTMMSYLPGNFGEDLVHAADTATDALQNLDEIDFGNVFQKGQEMADKFADETLPSLHNRFITAIRDTQLANEATAVLGEHIEAIPGTKEIKIKSDARTAIEEMAEFGLSIETNSEGVITSIKAGNEEIAKQFEQWWMVKTGNKLDIEVAVKPTDEAGNPIRDAKDLFGDALDSPVGIPFNGNVPIPGKPGIPFTVPPGAPPLPAGVAPPAGSGRAPFGPAIPPGYQQTPSTNTPGPFPNAPASSFPMPGSATQSDTGGNLSDLLPGGGGQGAGLNLQLAAQGAKRFSANVERWRPGVRWALATYGPGLGITNFGAWENALLDQIDTESDGDPFVTNTSDSNAAAGTPSSGLMQFIRPTYDAYDVTGLPYEHPYGQIAAALNYVMKKYGVGPDGAPNQIGQGHGYRTGGIMPLANPNWEQHDPKFPGSWYTGHKGYWNPKTGVEAGKIAPHWGDRPGGSVGDTIPGATAPGTGAGAPGMPGPTGIPRPWWPRGSGTIWDWIKQRKAPGFAGGLLGGGAGWGIPGSDLGKNKPWAGNKSLDMIIDAIAGGWWDPRRYEQTRKAPGFAGGYVSFEDPRDPTGGLLSDPYSGPGTLGELGPRGYAGSRPGKVWFNEPPHLADIWAQRQTKSGIFNPDYVGRGFGPGNFNPNMQIDTSHASVGSQGPGPLTVWAANAKLNFPKMFPLGLAGAAMNVIERLSRPTLRHAEGGVLDQNSGEYQAWLLQQMSLLYGNDEFDAWRHADGEADLDSPTWKMWLSNPGSALLRMIFGDPPKSTGPTRGPGGIPGHAGGSILNGMIRGAGSGVSDSIWGMLDGVQPIKVSNGESIIPAEATQKNMSIVKALLAGVDLPPVPGFNTGGLGDAGGMLPYTSQLRQYLLENYPGVNIGDGYRNPDGPNEHSSGRAIDVMIPNWQSPEGVAMGSQIAQVALSMPGVERVMWQSTITRADGSSSPQSDATGDPTHDHMDHVHIFMNDAAAGVPGAPANAGPFTSMSNGIIGSMFPGQTGSGSSAMSADDIYAQANYEASMAEYGQREEGFAERIDNANERAADAAEAAADATEARAAAEQELADTLAASPDSDPQRYADAVNPIKLKELQDAVEDAKEAEVDAVKEAGRAQKDIGKTEREVAVDRLRPPPKPPEKDKDEDKVRPDQHAQELGQGLVSGVLEGLGFDGSLFENPMEWGIWKLFTGATNYGAGLLKNMGTTSTGMFGPGGSHEGQATEQGTYAPPGSDGGGGGIMGLMSGLMSGFGVDPGEPYQAGTTVAPAASVANPANIAGFPVPQAAPHITGGTPGPAVVVNQNIAGSVVPHDNFVQDTARAAQGHPPPPPPIPRPQP